MLYCFSGPTYDVITFLICIMQIHKYLLKEKKIFPKGKRHFSLLCKAFQISSNYFLLHRHFNRRNKLLRLQQSLDRLKNASKPGKEVCPFMVYISSPFVKSGRNKEKRFTALLLCKFALITYDPTKSTSTSIALLLS